MEIIIVVAFGDDKDKAIDFEKEMKGEFFTPLQDDIELTTMKKVVMVVLCSIYVMVVERP